jgi:hypothetical protein
LAMDLWPRLWVNAEEALASEGLRVLCGIPRCVAMEPTCVRTTRGAHAAQTQTKSGQLLRMLLM